jgi:hypothetical protein
MTGNTSQNKDLDGRDEKTGRFLSGNNGGGRQKGSRNKLAGAFVDALYAEFQENGADVIKRVARDEPAQFLRVIAQVLPKELDVALTVNSDLFQECRDFLAAFRLSQQVIGGELDVEDLPLLEAVDATKEDS